MRRLSLKPIAIGMLLLLSAVAAHELTPRIKVADSRRDIQLEDAFPKEFDSWAVDPGGTVILPSPDVQANLDKVYNQVVTRAYVDKRTGYRVMLSVAYGGDQSDGLSVHRPEICYPAQGFEVTQTSDASLTAGEKSIPITRLLTQHGARKEPVTYWIVNGDVAVGRRMEARLIQLQYGFRGLIPDGLLIRISSIDPKADRAFGMQAEFAADLIKNVSKDFRPRLGG